MMLYGDRFLVGKPNCPSGEYMGQNFGASTLGCVIKYHKAFARMIFFRYSFDSPGNGFPEYRFDPLSRYGLRSESVAVALKLPCGLDLELPGGRRLILEGAPSESVPHMRKTLLDNGSRVNTIGFGLTPRVRLDDWLYISRIPDIERFIKSGLLFAAPDLPTAGEEAEKRINIFHGYEPCQE
jgi:hypothetical protein